MLIRGDCLKRLRAMPDGSVDIVVTSPPYNTLPTNRRLSGLGMHGVNRWFSEAANGYHDHRDENEYQGWLRSVVGECLRVAKGLVWVNHKTRYRNGVAIIPSRFLPFDVYAEIVWDRKGSVALNCRRYAPSHEIILGFGRPHFWDNRNNKLLNVWRLPLAERHGHPCPFPVELPLRLIESSCPPQGTVLDPFAGSATVGEACKRLGREFVGIEQNAEYIKAARRRLAA